MLSHNMRNVWEANLISYWLLEVWGEGGVMRRKITDRQNEMDSCIK